MIDYSIYSPRGGTYRISLGYSAMAQYSGLTLSVNGSWQATLGLESTGAWYNFIGSRSAVINLPPGENTLQLTVTTPGFNLGSISFKPITSTSLLSSLSSLCVQMTGAGAGTVAQQYYCNNTGNEMFLFYPTDGGFFEIRPQTAPLGCLDYGSGADGSLVQLQDCVGRSSQKWLVVRNADTSLAMASEDGATCASIGGNSLGIAAQLVMWSCAYGASGQSFKTGNFYINQYTTKNLAAPSTSNSAEQLSFNGHDEQKFSLAPMNQNSIYFIEPQLGAGTCLDYGSGAKGTLVLQKPCTGGGSQAWLVTNNADGSQRFSDPLGIQCMSVSGASNADGAQIIMWDCSSSNPSQNFQSQIALDVPDIAQGCPAGHRCFYVDPVNGNDKNNGLSTFQPWQSLNQINAVSLQQPGFLPGDVILLKAGQTFYGQISLSSNGAPGNPITISSYGLGSRPLITGGEFGILGVNVSFISISHIAVSNVTTGIQGFGKNQYWTVSHCSVSGFSSCGIGSNVSDFTNSNEGWVVKDNLIGPANTLPVADYSKAGIQMNGTQGAFITRNTVNTQNTFGIRVDDSYGNGLCDTAIVSYNEILDNYSGIAIGGCQNSIVSHNWIHDGHGYGISLGGSSTESAVHRSSYSLVSYNLIQNMTASQDGLDYNGIDINGGAINGKIYQNTIENVANHSVTFEGDNNAPSTGYDVRNNILDSRRQIPNMYSSGVFFHDTDPETETFANTIIDGNSTYPWIMADSNQLSQAEAFFSPSDFNLRVNASWMYYGLDPAFTNVAGEDLSISLGSPATHAGATINSFQQFNTDLGALPYGMRSVLSF